jgi:ribonucleoside-diphosphate reductase alpha chain
MTSPQAKDSPPPGMAVPYVFSGADVNPLDAIDWDLRRAEIKDKHGAVVWSQDGIVTPRGWSQMATDVVASKYFYGDPKKTLPDGRPEREHSVRQLVYRVCTPIADRGDCDGYFATAADADRFRAELLALCVNQYAAFNSPVWFNMGLSHVYGIVGPANNWVWSPEADAAVPCPDAYANCQASACFIQSVADDMGGIMALAASEAMLFKYGSGTGTDLSTLRSSREKVSGGGRASGPISFMRIYDATASVVKSGGKSRRAAKMQTLKCHHPDILEFIEAKPKEDRKAKTLIEAGYADTMVGHPDEAYSSVMFQNCNMSVRCTDAFLRLAAGIRPAPGPADSDWQTRAVLDGSAAGMPAYNACQLLDKIAEGTWACGDPGVQYEDTIQRWHTCPNTAPINSSNPCSEYMFIDDSACNLASINWLKFRREDGTIDDGGLRAAARLMITSQEIIVDLASYPTAQIAENSHKFRPLGLGFCNLGALLMACGYPYDSPEGRSLAALLAALQHGEAYLTSAGHAATLGPFEGFAANREPMLRVMRQHRDAVDKIDTQAIPELERLKEVAIALWEDVITEGEKHGYRNSQVTVIAPTGTIAFLMDADTTGIEPGIALVTYKNLAGGGQLKIVNRTVPAALRRLGYEDDQVRCILKYMEIHDTIEGCPTLRREHLPVFDCAFTPANGRRSISWHGHTRMMAAIQPFVSGAISKTVNMPPDATVDEIRDAYLEGWRLGLKALAIFRDGSKGAQPVSTSSKGSRPAAAQVETDEGRALRLIVGHLADFLGQEPAPHEIESVVTNVLARARTAGQPIRRKLPRTREALNHRFEIRSPTAGVVEGYVDVGFYPGTRQPGEIFITMSKQGSTIGGLMDVIATLVSMGLQYGVPLDVFVKKFIHTRFEPHGFTDNPDIPIARSVADYIFQWLGMEFIPGYREENAPKREQPADAVHGIRADLVAPAALDPVTGLDPGMYDRIVNGFGNNHSGGLAFAGTPLKTPNPFFAAWNDAAQPERKVAATAQLTGPPCPRCGSIMVPTGPCHRCLACGYDVGGCG